MKILLTIVALAAAEPTFGAGSNDFWKGFNETEEPYQHPWKEIPDLIDNKTVAFYFNVTHQLLLGIERGMYNNKSLTLNQNCFGTRYVMKANQIKAMVVSGWTKNVIPLIANLYQFWYMMAEQCALERTFNDFMIYLWRDGTTFVELGDNIATNWLYMTRALIDASIVWYEGIPKDINTDVEQWHKLSRQSGETMAEIFKEFTNFTVSVSK